MILPQKLLWSKHLPILMSIVKLFQLKECNSLKFDPYPLKSRPGPLNAPLENHLLQKIQGGGSYRLPCNNFYLRGPTMGYNNYKFRPLSTL